MKLSLNLLKLSLNLLHVTDLSMAENTVWVNVNDIVFVTFM